MSGSRRRRQPSQKSLPSLSMPAQAIAQLSTDASPHPILPRSLVLHGDTAAVVNDIDVTPTEPKVFASMKFDEGFKIKILIELLRNCLTDSQWYVSEDGILIRGSDGAIHVNVNMSASSIQDWKFNERVAVSGNLQFIHLAIRNIKRRDRLELSILQMPDGYYVIRFEPVKTGDNDRGGVFDTRVTRIEFPEQSLGIRPPECHYVKVNMETGEYHRVCREMHNLTRVVRIERNNTSLVIEMSDNLIVMKKFPYDGTCPEPYEYPGALSMHITKRFVMSHLYAFAKINQLHGSSTIYLYDDRDAPFRVSTRIQNYGYFDGYIDPVRGDSLMYRLPDK